MNILLASAHSTASWSSHLNMKIARLVNDFLEPTNINGGRVPSPFPLGFSSAFLVWFQAFSKLPLKCPPEAYIAM